MSELTPVSGEEWSFSKEEELLLHQLAAKQYWVSKANETGSTKLEEQRQLESPLAIPDKWSLLGDLKLFDWQKECIATWFATGKRGTVKVVTGAGKTILALGLMERLQSQVQPDLRVAVVAPTIVLMNQWYDEFIERSNLPPKVIGRLGGGYQDDFGDDRRVLLCVLNSAQAKLANIVAQAGNGQRLLLVVDECHRAGASVMSNIFKTSRAYDLGLSATPEREDTRDDAEENNQQEPKQSKEQEYNQSLLGQQLGPIIYHMTVETGFEMGILPSYEIRHYGLPLTLAERQQYERLSRSIHDSRQELTGIAIARGISSGGAFNRWCRALAQKGDDLGRLASRYIADMSRRKALLYRADARKEAVIALLKQELSENPDTRAILFHESIEEAMDLWRALVEAGLPAVPENSRLANSLREVSLDLFRRGAGQILVSVRSLVEGFNVPATDIGLIVASSTSVRQRIQTMGRVLRKHRTKSGEEKHALIQVLYMDQTVDDVIYAKTDWDRITGAERNQYFKWDPVEGTAPEEQPGPPRRPLPGDIDVDASKLKTGAPYPGAYEGMEFTADSSGNVYVAGHKETFAANPQSIPEQLKLVRGSYGRFKVTPNMNYVLTIVPKEDDWVTLFVANLEEPFDFSGSRQTPNQSVEIDDLRSGEIYHGPVQKDLPHYGHKRVRGRVVITKKTGKSEAYARITQNAHDQQRGRAAEQLIQALGEAEQSGGRRITELVITDDGYALYLRDGKWFYIGTVSSPLEFPDMS